MSSKNNRNDSDSIPRLIRYAVFVGLCLVTVILIFHLDSSNNGVFRPAGIAPPSPSFSPGQAEEITPKFAPPSSFWSPPEKVELSNAEYIVSMDIPLFRLVFEEKDWEAIGELVTKMVKQGVMTEQDRIWFPAKFHEGDRIYEVKARLRGDLADHWKGSYKSWRVKFAKTDLFHGVRELNFIISHDRAFYMEALGFHCARSQGLTAFRDGFARLALNDENYDRLYYMVEATTKEFLASCSRPESAIFRSIDIPFEAKNRKRNHYQYGRITSPENFKDYISNKSSEPLARAALGKLLDACTPTELRSILDIKKYAVAEAIGTLAGTRHCLYYNNLFLYLDETTGLFEPIIWDVNIFKIDDNIAKGIERSGRRPDANVWFQRYLIQDPGYRAIRDKVLWNYVKDNGKALIKAFDHIHSCYSHWYRKQCHKKDVYSSYEGRIKSIRNTLQNNIRRIKRELEYTKVFSRVYMDEFDNTRSVNMILVRNASFGPVTLEQIQIDATYREGSAPYRLYWDKNGNGRFDAEDALCGSFEQNDKVARIIFSANREWLVYSKLNDKKETVADSQTFFFTGGALKKQPDKFRFGFVNTVTGSPVARDGIYDTFVNLEGAEQHLWRVRNYEEFLAEYPSFKAAGEEDGSILLPEGRYEFTKNIFVPGGCRLVIEPGASLNFAPGTSLVSFSPLMVEGNKEKPVFFGPIDAEKGWGVVAVLGPMNKSSIFRHVEFKGYTEARCANAFLSGGLSVYSAPAELHNCRFMDGKGEDALNLKKSSGIIEGCIFKNNPSDAIDLDWSNVPVLNSRFENNKGDAIDLSGSRILLSGNIILNSGDKGISAGEKSNILLLDTYIHGCVIGVASKDLSRVLALGCTLVGNESGTSAYQKKALFGGGDIHMERCVIFDNRLQSSLDPWSKITFEHCLLQSLPKGSETNVQYKPEFIHTKDGTQRLENGKMESADSVLNEELESMLLSITKNGKEILADKSLGYTGELPVTPDY